MKMVMSIVNGDDAEQLTTTLTDAGHHATNISTTGGFLRQGNTTILVGVQDEDVPQVLQLIRDNCHIRTQLVSPLSPVMEPGEMYAPAPVEIQVGGATVFVFDVAHFEQF